MVVGSGPNGLAAAIVLAEAGLKVAVFEGAATVGGGTRTKELTLPGFHHDVCSAIHPMAAASPLFRRLRLQQFGLQWVHSPLCLAHPLSDGRALFLASSVEQTAAQFGGDAPAYRRVVAGYAGQIDHLIEDLLKPVGLPRHLLLAARFGWRGIRSSNALAAQSFQTDDLKTLWAGLSAHTTMPFDRWGGAAVPLMMAGAAHAYGWPVAKGGSQAIATALTRCLEALGGEVFVGRYIGGVDDLPPTRLLMLDLSPQQALAFEGLEIDVNYRARLARFRYGPGVFKVDWALAGPIPWRAAACHQAATVHFGGDAPAIAQYEANVFAGTASDRPFAILTQPSLFDDTRAPAGKHTAWAYCHVPNASLPGTTPKDMTAALEQRIEEVAPGFGKLILQRASMSPRQIETYNPNYIGGAISGGVSDLRQLFSRPVSLYKPYRLRGTSAFLCSASTPPGGGVHGLCGEYAAKEAIAWL